MTHAVGFVHNLILSNSCEFYYDDVTVTSFVNDKYPVEKEQRSVIHFMWYKGFFSNAIHSDIRPV